MKQGSESHPLEPEMKTLCCHVGLRENSCIINYFFLNAHKISSGIFKAWKYQSQASLNLFLLQQSIVGSI